MRRMRFPTIMRLFLSILALSSLFCIVCVLKPDWNNGAKITTFMEDDINVLDASEYHDNTHKAILLSYMRAGTTFVGSAFEKNRDILYVFEPEWDLILHSLKLYKPLHYVDGSVRAAVSLEEQNAAIKLLIQNYLRCNISGIDLQSLGQMFMSEGQHTKALYHCMKRLENKTDCVRNFTRVCNSKNVRFLKTVKLRMPLVEDLLKKDPTLRVLHLIRDPRGIAVSRLKWNHYYAAERTYTFARVCAKMLHDIEAVEKMPPELSNRVLPVSYEDVAENPEFMIENMYDFLQLPMPDYVMDHIKNVTYAKYDDRNGLEEVGPTESKILISVNNKTMNAKEFLSILRKNSSNTAYAWRSSIEYTLCKEIDDLCSKVYHKTGYLPVKSEADLRNLKIPLRGPHMNNYFRASGKFGETKTMS